MTSSKPISWAGLLAAASVASLSAGAQSFIFSEGHGDIGIAYEGGAFEPHWHLHAGAVVNNSPLSEDAEYAPGDALAYVPNPSVNRPAGAQWDFLGTAAGNPLWTLPQSNTAGKPFLGIASEELTASEWSSLTLSLVGLNGPSGGQFSLWQSDAFGSPVVKMASSDGFSSADTMSMIPGGHDHFFYGFTEPGVYQLTFKWDGTHTGDGAISATETFAFGVTAVPEPGEVGVAVALGLGGLAWFRNRRRVASGQSR
jgi:surface-anchored protein